ncbi:MAG: DMT family transporter [Microbacterium sp.]
MRSATVPTSALFGLLGLLWGASFLLIRIGLEGFSPAQVGLLRLSLGAATLTVVMLVSRRRWPTEPGLLGHLAVVAVLLFVIPVALYSWAGQHLPSSLAAVLNATTPLMTLVVGAVALRAECVTVRQGIGVVLGAAGVVVLTAPWQDAADAVPADGQRGLAVLACLGATASYGCAYTWMRAFLVAGNARQPQPDALALTAAQLVIATVITVAASPWTGVFAVVPHVTANVAVSVLLLGVFSTGLGYVWNTTITARWGAVRASQVTYLTPVVGVILGALILGERIGWEQLAGTAIVFGGIALTQRRAAREAG